MSNPVRVRFAPSPTGALHIGSIRTLLYNYLLATKAGGSFILRIEDTDQKRFVSDAENYILESLRWLHIIPDEGPEQGGPHAPYRQSERIAIYQNYLPTLLEAGHAYYAFDSEEELETMRNRLLAAKVTNPQYNAISRMWMKNSLTMPKEQVEEWITSGKPYVIRLKMPHKESIRFHDGVRGWVKVDTAVLDDKVLIKSNGIPTYHFANVVDDYLMKITHVIRGEEWLPSTPLHVLLYRYLGWEHHSPKFIHLPLLLAPNGVGKLSKRHADQYGFPVFPIAWQSEELMVKEGYREQGYLPDAFLNFLALLGWSPGGQQEVFTREALIETFSLEKLGKSGVKFDIAKAQWFNQQHIKQQDPSIWVNYFVTEAQKENIDCSEQEVGPICELVKDRVIFTKDFWLEGKFFYFDPMGYDEDFLQKKGYNESKESIIHFVDGIARLSVWNRSCLKALLEEAAETHGKKLGQLMPLIRMALTGLTAGPDLIDTMVVFGKSKTTNRMHAFLKNRTLHDGI